MIFIAGEYFDTKLMSCAADVATYFSKIMCRVIKKNANLQKPDRKDDNGGKKFEKKEKET